MRILGLDYGTKTVGVALSDERGVIAEPLLTITRERPTKLRKTYAQIEAIITEKEVEKIVIGLPMLLNGDEGERAEATRTFASDLARRTGLPVLFVDERLTTTEAMRILADTGVAGSGRKQYVDKMAAAIILQNYLDGAAARE